MKLFAYSLAFALLCGLANGQAVEKPLRSLITYCADDRASAFIPYSDERIGITHVGKDQLEGSFDAANGEIATFWLVRQGSTIFSFTVDDLESGSIWVAVDPAGDRFALTYSDGGATGGWHVRVFRIDGDTVIDASNAIQRAVADFKSRHYCEARGNNVEALKWIKGDLLLMTEVYDTGDCGPDMGHLEGYRVSVPDGTIKQHLTVAQLKRYPGVCLQNYEGN